MTSFESSMDSLVNLLIYPSHFPELLTRFNSTSPDTQVDMLTKEDMLTRFRLKHQMVPRRFPESSYPALIHSFSLSLRRLYHHDNLLHLLPSTHSKPITLFPTSKNWDNLKRIFREVQCPPVGTLPTLAFLF